MLTKNTNKTLFTILFVSLIMILASCGHSSNSSGSTPDDNSLKAGSIYYSDGTYSSAKNFDKSDTSKTPVAVIFSVDFDYVNGTKRTLGINIKQSGELAWAKPDSTGATLQFEKLKTSCSEDISSGTIKNADTKISKFNNHIDGKNSWEEIKTVDSSAATTQENYPAFAFVNNLNLNSGEITWYLPSLVELLELHKNMTAVNESLKVLYPNDSTQLLDGWYWSSSVLPEQGATGIKAWTVGFGGEEDNQAQIHSRNVTNDTAVVAIAEIPLKK